MEIVSLSTLEHFGCTLITIQNRKNRSHEHEKTKKIWVFRSLQPSITLLFLIFSIFLYVTANPIPSNSIDLSTDRDSFSVETDDVAKAGCAKDTASTEFSNEGDDNDVNIFRRGSRQTSCPAVGSSNLSNEIGGVGWRAPAVFAPPVIPMRLSTPQSEEFCISNPLKKILFTCSGPEIWYYRNVMGFVLHCYGGKLYFHHNLIHDWLSLGYYDYTPQSGPWPATRLVNRYCCHEGLYEVSSCLP